MKTKKRCQCGYGNTLQQINTGNKNLELLEQLQMPKPALQIPGQITTFVQQGSGKRRRLKRRRKMRGGAFYDKYGSPIHAY